MCSDCVHCFHNVFLMCSDCDQIVIRMCSNVPIVFWLCSECVQNAFVVAHPRSRLVNVQMNRRSVMVCVLRLAVYIFSEEVLTIEMSRIDWERLVCARAIYALPFKGQIPWELALKYAEVSVSRLRLFGATCWARSKLLMAKSKHLFLCSTQLCFR